jgi:hypothetical protein
MTGDRRQERVVQNGGQSRALSENRSSSNRTGPALRR